MEFATSFSLVRKDGLAFLAFEPLSRDRRILHAFSTRVGGVSQEPFAALNLGFGGGDAPSRVRCNRARFARGVGFPVESLVTLRQVHGNRVVVLREGDDPAAVHGTPADALMTNCPEVPIAVITADCFPVVLVARDIPAIAIIHSGRRGTARRIVPVTLAYLGGQYGTQPRNVSVAIGPGIGGCCYEVDESSAAPFVQQYHESDRIVRPSRRGHLYIDLQRAILSQLESAGVPSEQVGTANLCTACHPEWLYSYRREGVRSGRMLNVAMLTSS